MENTTKEVYFNVYCIKCVYAETNQEYEPCNECLANPSNENSHKPVNFKENLGVKVIGFDINGGNQ